MNDLLFYALLIALLYYFFLYLPAQKKANTKPITHPQATQTETQSNEDEPNSVDLPGAQFISDQKDLESTLDTLIKDIQALNKQIK